MPKIIRRAEPRFADIEDDEPERAVSSRRRRVDLFAAAGAVIVGMAIAGNALFLQKGQHPAPFFAAKPQPAAVAVAVNRPQKIAPDLPTGTIVMPRPRPVEATSARVDVPVPVSAPPVPPAAIPAAPAVRSQVDIVIELQKELARRGFYEGVPDGVLGPKTDGAIRDFAEAAGLKNPGEPNEALLRVVAKSSPRLRPREAAADVPRPPEPAETAAASKRLVAVQRALADYGYGQIGATGVLDTETQDAISQFERARRLPVTGQVSPRLVRELAALTGRPLE